MQVKSNAAIKKIKVKEQASQNQQEKSF